MFEQNGESSVEAPTRGSGLAACDMRELAGFRTLSAFGNQDLQKGAGIREGRHPRRPASEKAGIQESRHPRKPALEKDCALGYHVLVSMTMKRHSNTFMAP
jgi:hypothetical protein